MSKVLNLYGKVCKILNKYSYLPDLLLRFAIGWVFVEAGWGKLGKLDKVIGYFDSLGIPFASIQAPMVASLEFAGGLFIIFGLFTRIVSMKLAGVMFVAIMTAFWPDLESFTEVFSLSETAYMLIFIYLMFHGAGCLSVDAFLRKKYNKSF